MAIARRMGYGMKSVIGDENIQNAQTITKIMNDAGFEVLKPLLPRMMQANLYPAKISITALKW